MTGGRARRACGVRGTALRLAAAGALASVAAAGCSGSPGSLTGGAGSPGPTATSSPGSSPDRLPSRNSPFLPMSRALASRSGRITAALYDERTGQTWVYHGGLREVTASIVKVQIMGTAMRTAALAGRPLPGQLPASEQALIPTMIENSDNNAATAMLAKVGGPAALAAFDRAAGLTSTVPSRLRFIPGTTLPGWGLTTTTALDQVRLVRAFAYPGRLLSGQDRAYGLNLMEHVESDQAWGISGGVPAAGSTIALKNGWLPLSGAGWTINSIGWVSGHGRNYVLAVLTDHDPAYQYGIATIEQIAAKVYADLAPAAAGRNGQNAGF
ncbi:MAG TPA: serine hydrolase [Streptosporangiaceae bacterium]